MPAFLISCVGESGRPNAVAVSWLTPVSMDPPLLGLSLNPKHHSSRLIRENPVFVVNVMEYEAAPDVLFCGRRSGTYVDKFAETDLSLVPSRVVSAPSIAEAVAHVECELEDEYRLGGQALLVGRVVSASAAPGVLGEEWRDLEAARPLFYVGGDLFWSGGGEVCKPILREPQGEAEQ
jgi:flavin reductase (DIM6/NTAB) family NADH-FMN oxidoreductase RutF